mmetsp:Transcript_48289/g.138686  ORF Transcript_48289/g.138686 Transcript_48289/m.138686 type:complete len:205 (+) Transcript_48289:639-1253(+)
MTCSSRPNIFRSRSSASTASAAPAVARSACCTTTSSCSPAPVHHWATLSLPAPLPPARFPGTVCRCRRWLSSLPPLRAAALMLPAALVCLPPTGRLAAAQEPRASGPGALRRSCRSGCGVCAMTWVSRPRSLRSPRPSGKKEPTPTSPKWSGGSLSGGRGARAHNHPLTREPAAPEDWADWNRDAALTLQRFLQVWSQGQRTES